jgi:hypothetical protein
MKPNALDVPSAASICQVTVLTTQTGSLVITGGQGTAVGAGAGTQGPVVSAFYGVNVLAVTTTCTITPYAVSGTTTTQIAPQTVCTAAGLACQPAPAGVGVAFPGALVLVVTGTAAAPGVSVLWN